MVKNIPTKEMIRFISELRKLFPEIPCALRLFKISDLNTDDEGWYVVFDSDSPRECNMLLNIIDKTYEYGLKSNEENHFSDGILIPEQLRRVAMDDFWTWDRPLNIIKRSNKNLLRVAINGRFTDKKFFKRVENKIYLLSIKPSFTTKYLRPVVLDQESNYRNWNDMDNLLTFDISSKMDF